MRKFIFIIALVTFIFSSFQIVDYVLDAVKTRNMYDDISNLYHATADEDEIEVIDESPEIDEGPKNTERNKQNSSLDKLRELVNKDIIGWITVPNTKIDYPIVQRGDNEYYLDYNIHHEKDRHGAIFMDALNEIDSHKNLAIYGHHMRDGTMFKDLVKYKKEDFYKDNKIIELNIDGNFSEYEIFSVYITRDRDLKLRFSFKDSEDYEDYFNSVKRRSRFKSDLEFHEDKTMITLSTCTYEVQNGRLILHALPVDRE